MVKKESVVVGIVVLFLLYAALPTLGSMVGGALDEATSVLLAVAPKVAVLAGIAALIMLCIPFTRHHAHGMLFGAIVLAVGAAGFSTVVAWLTGHSVVVTADVLNAGNSLLARINGQGG
jgi:hypothetical protein